MDAIILEAKILGIAKEEIKTFLIELKVQKQYFFNKLKYYT